jgi:hypothetical protein
MASASAWSFIEHAVPRPHRHCRAVATAANGGFRADVPNTRCCGNPVRAPSSSMGAIGPVRHGFGWAPRIHMPRAVSALHRIGERAAIVERHCALTAATEYRARLRPHAAHVSGGPLRVTLASVERRLAASPPAGEPMSRPMSPLGAWAILALTVEYRLTDGNNARMPALAAELVDTRVDVIVTDLVDGDHFELASTGPAARSIPTGDRASRIHVRTAGRHHVHGSCIQRTKAHRTRVFIRAGDEGPSAADVLAYASDVDARDQVHR